ncbi:MAG: protease HtpX [Oligoflexales bacterium]|nr:protease HtpX [Oligoflexales bacterium]
MFKRFFLFALVNLAIIVMVSIILNVLGIRPYLTAYGINYSSLMAFCLVWGMVGSFISLLLSKQMAIWMMGVEIIDPRSVGHYQNLVLRVHNLARSAGLSKMPDVGIYPGMELNAFATGPSRNNSLVAVSQGLLNRMNDEEIDGVLGHEIGHIANGDMVTMTLIQGVVNAFVMFFARIAAFAVGQILRGDDDERGGVGMSGFAYMITVFLFEIIFGILGSMVTAWFSRIREFRADVDGARYAGRGNMIKALERLNRETLEISDNRGAALQALKISGQRSKFLQLLSTHPPLEVRIDALRKMRTA